MNKKIITLLILLTGSAHAGGVPITGNQNTDRVLNYGALGGLIGAIIGHNVGGDPDENRDIGAAIGAISAGLYAKNLNQQAAVRQAEELKITQQINENQRRQMIQVGYTIQDHELLQKEQANQLLINRIAQREKEIADATNRANRMAELDAQRQQLEARLSELQQY